MRVVSQATRGHKRAANTNLVSSTADKKNDMLEDSLSQRPQRAISLSRIALEALESNSLARTSSQQTEIDVELDS